MNRYPLSLYLLPFILLLIIVLFIQSSGDMGIGKALKWAGKEKPAISAYKQSDGSNKDETESPLPFESRIPVYPNSEKAALREGEDVKEAAFFTTTDSIDDVKKWYLEKLGGFEKVNLIDIVNKDDLRVITISMPDPPKELVEIRERFKGAKDLLITITTIEFYTRNQPRPMDFEKLKESGIQDEDEKKDGENAVKEGGDGDA